MRTTLGRFVRPAAIVGRDLTAVAFDVATNQLADIDLDVGINCRRFIEDAKAAMDDEAFMEREAAWDVTPETEKAFFRFVHL